MLVPIWMGTNMASYTNLYKSGWHISANSARIKYSRDLILGEVVYIAIIYHIPDSWIYLSNGYDFSFDHMTDENREFHELSPSADEYMLALFWYPEYHIAFSNQTKKTDANSPVQLCQSMWAEAAFFIFIGQIPQLSKGSHSVWD